MIVSAHAAEDAISDASIVTYEPEYFEKFAPVTLLDMLQRIPGVPEILNSNRRDRSQRGFGSGGDQILIDGKRLAGKSNNINDTLSRISSNQIAKIELIRGAASGLDVQSQGLVINITMNEGASKSTTFWEIFGEYTFGHKFIPQFLIAHSGSAGNLDYTLTAERKNDDGFRPRFEEFYDASGTKTGEQDVDDRFKFRGLKFTSNLTYNFDDGGELRLNGLYEPNEYLTDEIRLERGATPDYKIFDGNKDIGKWEVGGDFSRDFENFGYSKTLFVINRSTEDEIIDRFRGQGASQYLYEQEDTDEKKMEKIFRSSLTNDIFDDQSLEVGGEAAINNFDKTYNKYNSAALLDPLDLSNTDDVAIQENRYEVFAVHSYNVSPEVVLQSSLTTEFSKIVADNNFADGSTSRRDTNFTYFKPRMNIRYDYTESDQLRFTVEKKVSQLNFDNFVTSYNQQTNVVTEGNTNIRPTQTWEFNLAYEHRLANDGGSLEGEIYFMRRNDHTTRVDFTEYVDYDGNPISVDEFFALDPDEVLRQMIRDGSGFTPKQGNIPHANIYGINVKSNLRLGFVGVPEAVLSLGYRYEKRRSLDQFLQVMRNFSRHSDHEYNVNFRHDITALRFSYGFDANIKSDYAEYDMQTFWPTSPSANISAFAEYNLQSGIKMRVELLEISGSKGHSTLYDYNDHIRFDDLSERIEKENDKPRSIKVSLQGSF